MTKSIRRLLAAVVAGAFFCLGLPVASAQEADAGSISEGTVTWGIKESWRNYVGLGDTSGGVVANEDRLYEFPVTSGTFDQQTSALDLNLGGSIQWLSYCSDDEVESSCLLNSTMSNFSLHITPEEQVIRADYRGYPREDPGGEMETYEDVVIADLDISSVNPSISGSTVTWTEIPATSGSGFVLYGVGTPIDPVTISYTGLGGKPSTEETFDAQGIPSVYQELQYDGFNYNSKSASFELNVYSSVKGNQIHAIDFISSDGVVGDSVTVKGFDPSTLVESGKAIVVTPEDGQKFVPISAYSPKDDTIYFISEPASGCTKKYTLYAASLLAESNRYIALPVTDFEVPDNAACSIRNIGWNSSRNELQIYLVRKTNDGFIPTVISYGDREKADRYKLDTKSIEYADDSIFRQSSKIIDPFGFYHTFAMLGDGVLFPSSGKFQVDGTYQSGTAFYVFFDENDDAHLIDIHNAYSADDSGYYGAAPYYGVFSSATGLGVLMNGGWGCTYSLVDLDDGQPVISQERLSYGDGGAGLSRIMSSGVSDSERGVDYVFDNGEIKLTTLKDGVPVRRINVEGARAADGPNRLAIGNDGSVYYAGALQDGNKQVLIKFTYAGITPTVTEDPADQSVTLGASDESTEATFSVAYDSESDATITWQKKAAGGKKFQEISGETGNELTIDATEADDGAQYRAVIENKAGKVVSETATLTVAALPRFTQQPTDITAREGDDATFVAVADEASNADLTWEVYEDGGWKTIEDNDTYTVDGGTLTVKTTADLTGTQYRAVLTNDNGTTVSDAVTLTVTDKEEESAPTVVEQPQSAGEVEQGTEVTLISRGSGNSFPKVQWQMRSLQGDDYTEWEDVEGATTTTLTVKAEEVGTYQYRAVFTNELGTAESTPATITVVPEKEEPNTDTDTGDTDADTSPSSVAKHPSTDVDAQNTGDVTVTSTPSSPSASAAATSTAASTTTSAAAAGTVNNSTTGTNGADSSNRSVTSAKPNTGELAYTGNHTNPALIAVLALGLVGCVLGGGLYLTKRQRDA